MATADQPFSGRTAGRSEYLIDSAAQHLGAVEPACSRRRHAHSRGRSGTRLLPRLVLVWTVRIRLRPALAFKGGTALKRCYFSDYRLSEDLDFTLREPLAFEDIRARLERIYGDSKARRASLLLWPSHLTLRLPRVDHSHTHGLKV